MDDRRPPLRTLPSLFSLPRRIFQPASFCRCAPPPPPRGQPRSRCHPPTTTTCARGCETRSPPPIYYRGCTCALPQPVDSFHAEHPTLTGSCPPPRVSGVCVCVPPPGSLAPRAGGLRAGSGAGKHLPLPFSKEMPASTALADAISFRGSKFIYLLNYCCLKITASSPRRNKHCHAGLPRESSP